jgi:uncharacterized protein (DUF433 family)
MEVRFVNAFRKAGLPLQRIRILYAKAQEIIENDRPFSSAKFHTDGNTIFLDIVAKEKVESDTLDLKNCQHVFKKFIEPTFLDIQYREGQPIKWHPDKKRNIIIDPTRSFGQPILEKYYIPTATLMAVFSGNRSYVGTAKMYGIPTESVKDAIEFENRLNGI